LTNFRPCALCGETAARPLFAVGADRYLRCRACGFVQMSPLPASEGPGEDYKGFDLESYAAFMAEFRRPQYERDLALIRQYASTGRLLDIGCGLGDFLDVAAAGGFRAYGLEPSRTASGIARRRHPVVRGELGRVKLREGAFAVATIWSVLEHVPDPAAFLAEARALLAPGGVLALRVPDVRGLLPALALASWRLTFHRLDLPLRVLYQLDWHYKHLTGFDRRTIVRLLERGGFSVEEVRSEPSFSFRSLRRRMDYLPLRGPARAAARAALGAILVAARLTRRPDELVVLARKKG
jgi:2-polyprenyl-3-methyl-5-hydroxy-6-metoxy-1,4-benzoquinol methylase